MTLERIFLKDLDKIRIYRNVLSDHISKKSNEKDIRAIFDNNMQTIQDHLTYFSEINKKSNRVIGMAKLKKDAGEDIDDSKARNIKDLSVNCMAILNECRGKLIKSLPNVTDN